MLDNQVQNISVAPQTTVKEVPLARGLPVLGAAPEMYAAAVTRETLRLYPAGWIYGRTAERDDVLRGHQIRQGDMLGICPLVTHRLSEAWPDPERFDPERFMGDDKAEGNRNFTYFPFGAGKHMCIGIHLAMMEMQIVLAMFVRRVRLAVVRPEAVRMKSKITLQVAGGLPVKVEMRSR